MEFREVFPFERTELERLLNSGNDTAITDALLSAAYYDADWKWVQAACLRFLNHPERTVRWTAATCLGHVARIHRQLDLETVVPRLMELKADPSIDVEDAIEDIKFFLRTQ